MLEGLIAKIGVPLLLSVLSEALGSVDNPVARGAAKALGDVDRAIAQGQISNEQIAEANRHAEAMAAIKFKEYEASIGEVNKSIRAEIESEDKFVRRMRPTFGYLMAITWAAQMFGLAYVIVFETPKAAAVMHGMSSLSVIWAVGLSVLGVYVYKRSEDKRLLGQLGQDMIFWNQDRITKIKDLK